MLGKKRVNYIIKKPDSVRNSFSILIQTTLPDKTREPYKKFEDSRLDALNKEWKFSDKSDHKKIELLKKVEEIRKELNDIQRKRDGRDRLHKNQDNEKILQKFFEERINHRRDIVSHDEMRFDFSAAVEKIGNISLQTASKIQIQDQINKIEKNSIHRRVCSRINSLLAFIGRKERVQKALDDTDPFVIKENEFLQLLLNIKPPEGYDEHKDDIKNLFIVLYYTGLRIGEAFALQNRTDKYREYGKKLNYVIDNHVYVNAQMLQDKVLNNIRKNKYDSTKTGKARISFIYPNKQMKKIEAWINLPLSEKEKIRDIGFSYVLKKSLLKTFPDKLDKMGRMKAHDCRHSYAANMLNLGLNISQVAKLLGNGVNVSEKFYLPYSASEEALELIEKIVQKNKKVS